MKFRIDGPPNLQISEKLKILTTVLFQKKLKRISASSGQTKRLTG